MNNDSFIVKIKKHKVAIILTIVFWLFAELFLIAPLAVAIVDSSATGVFDLGKFIEYCTEYIVQFKGLTNAFKIAYIKTFCTSTIFFTIFIGICLGIGLWKGRKRGSYDKIEHGSSDWSVGGEQYRVLSRDHGLILAEDNYLPLDKLGNTNVLIVGGSGSGKSSAYTIPNAHQCLGSYIFTDPKGEIYDATAGYLKSQGYEIKLLNLVNPDSSDSYNPIQHVKSELDVDVIANTIVKGQKSEAASGADPYWDNMAELLLKALIYYLIAARPPEEQNLASCAELVRAANNKGNTNLLSELINKLPYDHPARMNYKSVEIASDKTYSSILSSLQSKLGKFDSKEIANVTSTNTINFDDIATKKTALYVVSSDTHTAYDFLLTIFFSQMIQQLYDYADKNGGRLPLKTFFILDEFSNIGQIPDFDKKISTSRSRGISFSVILQNLDQLKALYDKSYETIIGNCDTHVFLGSNSYATVEYFSKELGEKTITHYSKSVNRTNQNDRKGYSESDQIMARALMTPDELRRLDNAECIIFEKGIKPIRAKKYFWFRKSKIVNDLNSTRIDHNDYDIGDRGEWRKFDPYNPFSGNQIEDNREQDFKVESLDDLFNGELDNNLATETNQQLNQQATQPVNQQPNQQFSQQQFQQPITNNSMDSIQQPIINNSVTQPINTETISSIEAPPPVQQTGLALEDEIDIQKELEAKFDELFGPMEE